jgi:putative ABC transport system permease protein
MRVGAASNVLALRGLRAPLPLKLAFRDLRGGISGFAIFLICIALGTGAIGTINSLSDAIQGSIAREGQQLLGGDLEASLVHRQATQAERAFLASLGEVSEVASLRAMARKPDGSAQTLIDLKAVDRAYPLYGAVTFEEGSLATLAGEGAAAVDHSILDRLQIGLGSQIVIGRAAYRVGAIIEHEPDRLGAGPAFGARVLIPASSLDKTGLVEPGSLVRWSYRIKTPGPVPAAFRKDLAGRFPEAGFMVRDAADPSPGVTNILKRLTEFLTLTGLTAMLTGGIGVANAVAGFVERRRKTIAIFKTVGAPQRIILRVLLLEIGLLALLGIAVGFAIAAFAPAASVSVLRGLVPIDIDTKIQAGALALAALFGSLTAIPFILWPVGRARQVRAAELLRENGGERESLPPTSYRAASVIAATLLAAAAIGLSQEHKIAAMTCAAVLGVFGLFWAAGTAIRRLAAKINRPRRPELALALTNIAGPGSFARTIAISLGTGLTLLTAVSLVDASLTEELKSRLPEHAPSYFFIGIPKQDLPAFLNLVNDHAPAAKIATAPMLRGRIVALRDIPVDQFKADSSAQWVLNGDRGITYSGSIPNGSQVTEGAWWPEAYEGEPLVSFEGDIAKALGLKIGDTVKVNVIGRNITARIANFRKVQWGSMDINFVMIFSPNALRKAPFNYLATLSWPGGAAPDSRAEAETLRILAATYPAVSAIAVKDALGAINGVFEKVMRAIRIAGSVTLIMGGLVVAGALMAAQRRRVYEAVVLRTLGASRRRILSAHLLEYLILSLFVSALAGLLGLVTAYAIVNFVMKLTFSLSVQALLQPSLFETIFVLALGSVGTCRVLSAKQAQYLRSE